jgi:hypothetical protein
VKLPPGSKPVSREIIEAWRGEVQNPLETIHTTIVAAKLHLKAALKEIDSLGQDIASV